MKDNDNYDVLMIIIGAFSLYMGLRWKKPSYGGGIAHKYGAIALGFIFIVFGVKSIFC